MRNRSQPVAHGRQLWCQPGRHLVGVATGDLQIGTYVEVTKGFLQGRRGIVQQIDDKGGFRVSFGALASRIDNEELRGFGPAPADQGRFPRRDRGKKRPK